LPVNGTALLSGWVRNVVDEKPIEDVEVEMDLGEIIKSRLWDKADWWHSEGKIKMRTDKQGEYSLQVNARYFDRATWKYRSRIEPVKEGYEVTVTGITENGPKKESDGIFSFTLPRQNFYMFDTNTKAIINGRLKGDEGKNVGDIPIKITLTHLHDGKISEADIITTANGGFSYELPIKYIYVFKYRIVISVQIGEKIVKRYYKEVLKPGQRERQIQESLIYGIGVDLNFSVLQ